MKKDDRIIRVHMVMIISVEVSGEEGLGFQELVRGEGIFENVKHVEAAQMQFDFERSLRGALAASNATKGVRITSATLEPPASKAIVVSKKVPSPKKPPGKGGSGANGAN